MARPELERLFGRVVYSGEIKVRVNQMAGMPSLARDTATMQEQWRPKAEGADGRVAPQIG